MAEASLIKRAALSYAKAGLSVLPVGLHKRPLIKSWGDRQKSIPTEAQIEADFSKPGSYVGIVSGRVSGPLELLDFDHNRKLYTAWVELVETERPGLVNRLVMQGTQSGGNHIAFRCLGVEIPGNTKLASGLIEVPGPGQHEFEGKTYEAIARNGSFYLTPCYIETRGEGGYFLAFPNPGYNLEQGDFCEAPDISPEERETIIGAARALHKPLPEEARGTTKPARERGPGELSPGDDYNERGNVSDLLVKNGWANTGQKSNCGTGEHWRRPGKDKGQSATLFDGGSLYIFSTNTQFEADRIYNPFSIYAVLEHAGDFSAAAKALAKQGYGSKYKPTTNQKGIEKPGVVKGKQSRPVGDRAGKPLSASISLSKLMAHEFPERPNVIDRGLLPEGGGLILAGESGVGKSLMTLEWAANLIMGWEVLGFDVPKARKVALFQAENPMAQVQYRIRRVMAGLEIQDPPDHISFSNPKARYDLNKIQTIEAMTTLIKTVGADVFIIDPLSSFHQRSENSNEEMRQTLDNVTSISRETGASAIVIHHFGKPSQDRATAYRFRGAMSIKDWCDTMIAVTTKRHENKILRDIKFIKVRHGPEPRAILVERDENFIHTITEEETLCPPGRVKEILEGLGGYVESQKELMAAIVEDAACSQRSARRYIQRAIDMEAIIENNHGHGKKKTYYAQP